MWKITVVFESMAFCFVNVDETVDFCQGKGRSRGRGTWQDMLRSPFMWVVCVSYMVLFMGRTATLDWGQLYLIQELGQSPYIG